MVVFVEHHNRPRTEVMLHGLEQIPRKELEYRSTVFTEMDVDAVLARQPPVALVDELRDTNTPGSRNTKRWQDVEELLAAGIDVITTVNIQHVNIQHLESLGDVVESITGVRQQETVPDEVVRRADQIELVDMSPQALLWVADRVDEYLHPETLPMVAVDPGLLERSVASLVENAVKYSPAEERFRRGTLTTEDTPAAASPWSSPSRPRPSPTRAAPASRRPPPPGAPARGSECL